LQQEANTAKNKLIEEINAIKKEESHYVTIDLEDSMDPRVRKFTVRNPVKVGGNIKYTVEGVDDEGDFSIVRRYREFNALSTVLKMRWPGCYIPAIPEKGYIKDKSEQFVEERRSLLERFMREIAKFDYIIFSKEFKLFARG